jgi:sulfite reductase (NADPH) flavoprotein alpha-component
MYNRDLKIGIIARMNEQYDRNHPFLAKIAERRLLSKEGSAKETYHLVLDLKGSGLSYKVGDSIGVLPRNPSELAEHTLTSLQASGEERVIDKQGKEWPLREYLLTKANLRSVSRKMAQETLKRLVGDLQKELSALLESEDAKERLHAFEVWDFLKRYAAAAFTLQETIDLMMPLLPRFYSIASSQPYVGEEVHLTVRLLSYESQGIPRVGSCTYYLCKEAPIEAPEVPIYVHPGNDFALPSSGDVPIIMIGPGTGVAPFRAFVQERKIQGHSGKNWLFFGEWTRGKEYFYEEEWNRFEAEGFVRITTAFSRDQPQKIYVQHRMEEHAKELFRWIDEGAILYVCGDAHHMAKDVEAMLHKIIMREGNLDEKAAQEYIKRLRHEKRYLRDVY